MKFKFDHAATAKALPVLAKMGLSAEELTALARQGFIASEKREHRVVFRLRYRLGGRQRARYVSRHDVEAVAAELSTLQERARSRRRVKRLAVLARDALRQRKALLAPFLEAHGRYYHGYQVRQRRMMEQ